MNCSGPKMSEPLTWEETNAVIAMVRQEFIRLHNQPKLDEVAVKAVRKITIDLHYRRIQLCIEQQQSRSMK